MGTRQLHGPTWMWPGPATTTVKAGSSQRGHCSGDRDVSVESGSKVLIVIESDFSQTAVSLLLLIVYLQQTYSLSDIVGWVVRTIQSLPCASRFPDAVAVSNEAFTIRADPDRICTSGCEDINIPLCDEALAVSAGWHILKLCV